MSISLVAALAVLVSVMLLGALHVHHTRATEQIEQTAQDHRALAMDQWRREREEARRAPRTDLPPGLNPAFYSRHAPPHEVVPVVTGGEVVAHLCVTCDEQLPAWWGPLDPRC